MTTIYVPYYAGVAPLGIAEMWAAGMRTTEVHRSTDWDGESGTFTLYTDGSPPGGSEPSLVETQEEYIYTDTDGDSTYAYKVRHKSPAGKLTDFSDVITVADQALTNITDEYLKAAYLSPDNLQAPWKEFDLTNLNLTEVSFGQNGNRPWVIGTDYQIVLALLYVEETDGDEEGHDLSGATITVTISDEYGNVIKTKDNDALGGVTLRNQAIKQSLGGTMGEFEIAWTDTETDDDSAAYVANQYRIDGQVTWASGDKTLEFRGTIDAKRSIPT